MAKVVADVADRFWSKCIPEPNSGCWLWTAAINSNGYGSFGIGSRTDKTRKVVTSSRFAYELICGPIDDDRHVLHRCDNPVCVNLDHLYLGTRSQNMQDAYDRGRQPCRSGTLRPNSKLTEGIVAEMRRSNKTDQELSKETGCSRAAIHAARICKTWRHVNG